MASTDPISVSQEELARENSVLRSKLALAERKLAESQELLQSIQHGGVDSISGRGGEQVFSLRDSEEGYRALVEAMSEGAATLAADGTVLYCNRRLSDLLGVPVERIVGSLVTRHLSKRTAHAIEALMGRARADDSITIYLNLRSVRGRCVPVRYRFAK